MDKIKLLVAPGDKAGSGKFRCIDPHITLQNNFSSEFFIDVDFQINFDDETYLKKYDAIFLHRTPQHNYPKAVEIINNLKRLGLKVIIDTDDHWTLDPSHGLYESSKFQNIPSIILDCIKLGDIVTAPTQILADQIKPHNKNVFVLPNAIDPTEPQFQPKPTQSELIRFGWLGGSSHIRDMELLEELGSRQSSFDVKTQFVVCGFDTRGTVRMLNKETGKVEQRKMEPQETVWFLYEMFMTDTYRNLAADREYIEYLIKFKEDPNYDDLNKVYRRIWTKPVNQYATGYNQFDVALAPLRDTSFNLYKSQLKVIEAGFHKKALIAQNYGPYTIDLIGYNVKGGGINPDANAMLVDPAKNHKQWIQHVKKLSENPNLIKDLGEKLYETVKDKYNLTNVTNYRAEIYKELMK